MLPLYSVHPVIKMVHKSNIHKQAPDIQHDLVYVYDYNKGITNQLGLTTHCTSGMQKKPLQKKKIIPPVVTKLSGRRGKKPHLNPRSGLRILTQTKIHTSKSTKALQKCVHVNTHNFNSKDNKDHLNPTLPDLTSGRKLSSPNTHLVYFHF